MGLASSALCAVDSTEGPKLSDISSDEWETDTRYHQSLNCICSDKIVLEAGRLVSGDVSVWASLQVSVIAVQFIRKILIVRMEILENTLGFFFVQIDNSLTDVTSI